MAFVLSKLLIVFLQPFLWVIALVIAGLIVKRPKVKKRLFVAAAVVLIIFSNPFLVSRVIMWWNYGRPMINPAKRYSCAIVLGGFASEDAQGNGFFNSSADRFIQGLRLKDQGQVSHILITGGSADIIPDRFREADWVGQELKVFNVPDSAVLIEDRARNTVENARYSKALLISHHLQPPYLLVTSAFHMRRALVVCAQEQLQVIPYASSFDGTPDKVSVDDFIPSANALGAWTIYLKEFVGIMMLKLKH